MTEIKIAKIFRRSQESTPIKTMLIPGFDKKRPNYAETYYNANEYPYPCRTCGGKATYQVALFNHIREPQGSLYYCEKDCPTDYTSKSD